MNENDFNAYAEEQQLKEQGYLERIGALTQRYEQEVNNLRVALTTLTSSLEVANQQVAAMSAKLEELELEESAGVPSEDSKEN